MGMNEHVCSVSVLFFVFLGVVSAEIVTCEAVEELEVRCGGRRYFAGELHDVSGSTSFYIHISIAAGLTLLAGVFSGLTMGLLSLDFTYLNVLATTAGPLSVAAQRVLPLAKRHHLLLTTLVLANAMVTESLPLVLDRLFWNPYISIALSVSLILLFGEIVPQAICTRWGLRIGAACWWFVWILIGLLFVIAWPISKLLDVVLGTKQITYFRRSELKELVSLHGGNDDGILSADEVAIIRGALEMTDKTLIHVFTPLDQVDMLEISTKLDMEVIKGIAHRGHSRIPIFSEHRHNIVGMISVKKLVDLNAELSINCIPLLDVPKMTSDTTLFSAFRVFRSGKSHLAAVMDPVTWVAIGIVTLEDIVEELIQSEIYDEKDVYVDINRDLFFARAFRRGAAERRARSASDASPSPRRWRRSSPIVFEEVFDHCNSPLTFDDDDDMPNHVP